MFSNIATEPVKKFLGQVYDDVLGYLRIYDFCKMKLAGVTGKKVAVPSVESFWYSILADQFAESSRPKFVRLRDGDRVEIKGGFLTEWAPKLPGRIWTKAGLGDYREGLRHVGRVSRLGQGKYDVSSNDGKVAILDPFGKRMVVSAGFGSIRVSPMRNDDFCAYLGLVDSSSSNCDYGIPVVVSRSVFKSLQPYLEMGAPEVKSLEGVLRMEPPMPFEELVPTAIGASLSREARETLRYRPGLPRCYLHVVSQLSLKLRYNDSHPTATAWTMFETRHAREKYRYTYIDFDPMGADSIDHAVEFINWYVREYGGSKVITDFDGRQPRLEAMIPPSPYPFRSRKGEVASVFKNLDLWTRRILREGQFM